MRAHLGGGLYALAVAPLCAYHTPPRDQGLTLVHFSAQPEPFLT